MSLQKGINRLRMYQEHAATRCVAREDVVLSVEFDVNECLLCFLLCAVITLWIVRTMIISDFFTELMKISVNLTDLSVDSYQRFTDH